MWFDAPSKYLLFTIKVCSLFTAYPFISTYHAHNSKPRGKHAQAEAKRHPAKCVPNSPSLNSKNCTGTLRPFYMNRIYLFPPNKICP